MNVPLHETIGHFEKIPCWCQYTKFFINQRTNKYLVVVLKQNYFSSDNKYFIQKESPAMSSPLTGLLSDIYLNRYENACLLSNSNKLKGKIVHYTFVMLDDTLGQI